MQPITIQLDGGLNDDSNCSHHPMESDVLFLLQLTAPTLATPGKHLADSLLLTDHEVGEHGEVL